MNGAYAKSISTRRDRADERLDSKEQPLVSNVDLPPQEPLDRRKRQEDEIQRERELESSSHLVEKAAACKREADHLIEGRVLGGPSLLEAGQLRQSLCVREEAVLFHEGEEPLSEHPASPHSRVEGADRRLQPDGDERGDQREGRLDDRRAPVLEVRAEEGDQPGEEAARDWEFEHLGACERQRDSPRELEAQRREHRHVRGPQEACGRLQPLRVLDGGHGEGRLVSEQLARRHLVHVGYAVLVGVHVVVLPARVRYRLGLCHDDANVMAQLLPTEDAERLDRRDRGEEVAAEEAQCSPKDHPHCIGRQL
mmetsp:Transcript_35804/g.109766  ORF Transcript_35804/g.109766 Transcript_35804/m.109766 type:complete len:310 (+) Transcript_35804:247-1176(+)